MGETEMIFLIGAVLALVAMLYSSVGHGGASGYIAVLALAGLAPETVRPVALSLNVVAAGLATWRFARAGLVDWKAVVPLIAASMPMAFIGGSIALPPHLYRPLLGVLLIFSGGYLIWRSMRTEAAFVQGRQFVPPVGSAAAGAGIGLLSGLSGIGGGVLLSPFFLISGWAGARQTAGIAAVFILANSLAGLAGNYLALKSLPIEIVPWAGLVLAGSLIGTSLGVRILPVRPLVWLLAAAVLIAGLKFLLL